VQWNVNDRTRDELMENIDIAITLLALVVGMYVADIPRAYKRHRELERERKARKFLKEDWDRKHGS
jgi:hypothetical protein